MTPFDSRESVRQHMDRVMAFYHPRCIDAAGGFHQFFRADGSVYQPQVKHLVSSTRMIANYAFASQQKPDPACIEAIRHGLRFLRGVHRNQQTGGYAWVIENGSVKDATNHCYGLAFVMLAYAKAIQAGVVEARPWLEETWELLEKRFWEPQAGLYADEATADWKVSGYRGQNANMHMCEATLAAHEATGERKYLERAALLADHMVNRQAAACGGQVWEHYDSQWRPDWEYNKGDRSNIFRPWGLQPGHQVEWAKLLLLLDRREPQPWRRRRAQELFAAAMRSGWDAQHGGVIYGYDQQGAPYDTDKYSWVQVESMATAALLADVSGDAVTREWFGKLAAYCEREFVDPQTGCWYRIKHPDNRAYGEEGCFSGLTDYHTMSACSDLLGVYRS